MKGSNISQKFHRNFTDIINPNQVIYEYDFKKIEWSRRSSAGLVVINKKWPSDSFQETIQQKNINKKQIIDSHK